MSQPSITVQYSPFLLTLEVTREGGLVAALRRVTDPPAAPALVFAASDAGRASVGNSAAGPVLWIGSTGFAVPKRQLARVAVWLDGQSARIGETVAPDKQHDPVAGDHALAGDHTQVHS